MKKILAFFLLTQIALVSCKDESPTTQVKLNSLSGLSPAERMKVTNDLVVELKEDSDFKKFSTLNQLAALEYLARDKKKDLKPKREKSHKVEDLLAYYKKRGLHDPQRYVRRKLGAYFLLGKVYQKHPKLKDLTKEERSKVLNAASDFSRVVNTIKSRHEKAQLKFKLQKK